MNELKQKDGHHIIEWDRREEQLFNSSLSSFNLSTLLPHRIKRILFFAKISAVAFPIPEVAPVIKAVCFMFFY